MEMGLHGGSFPKHSEKGHKSITLFVSIVLALFTSLKLAGQICHAQELQPTGHSGQYGHSGSPEPGEGNPGGRSAFSKSSWIELERE